MKANPRVLRRRVMAAPCYRIAGGDHFPCAHACLGIRQLDPDAVLIRCSYLVDMRAENSVYENCRRVHPISLRRGLRAIQDAVESRRD